MGPIQSATTLRRPAPGWGQIKVEQWGQFRLTQLSVPSRGPPQVHRRSVRGPRKLRCTGHWKPVHPWPVLHSAGQAWARQARLPDVVAQMKRHGAPGGTVPPRSKPIPDISRVLATARGSRGAVHGPDHRTTSDLPGVGGLFTKDGGPLKARCQRFGEPLLQPRFRPLYVRNHRGAATSPDRR